MKRIICFLLALVLILPCLPGTARAEIAGDCGDNLSWIYADGVLTVYGSGPMFSYDYQDAPWCLGAMDVRQVILEEGVTEVGSFAFRDCTNLERVVFPASLKTIGQGAFSECNSLTALYIPDIAAWMQVEFALWYEELYDATQDAWREEEVCSNPLGCNDRVILYVDGQEATTLTFPEGLTAVGSNSFRGYKNLTTLNLPASVKTFGDNAFLGCTRLQDVYYSGTPTQLPSIHYGKGNELLIRADWHFEEAAHTHSYGEWETVTAPSCAEPGLEHRYCAGCDHYQTREIPVTDHVYGEWETVTASNCTEPGLEHRYCVGCDHYKTREIPVTDHVYGQWKTVKSSTTKAAGQQRKVCQECDAAETRSIPKTPTVTVSADTSSGKPKLSWNLIDGADKYRIYRSSSKSGTYSYLATAAKTGYRDTSAKAGTSYYYKVRSQNAETGLYSGYSPVVNLVCDLPRPSVTLSVNTASGKPVVKWETVEGAAKYYVYRSTQKSSGYKKVYTAVKARSYEDSAAVAGTTYYYKVMAVHENSSANSVCSTVLSRVCDLAKPTITITLNSKGHPYLKWSAVGGTLRYRIYRSETKSGTYDYIGATTSLKYADKTAKARTKYYYKVRAVHKNAEANSAYSSAKAITAK